ncbi:MAG TPA: hypothetical protein GXX37_15510 [Clostridiaceae bacterium]|nr:hypothetical protein [Clostridiaceae bacterium]
MNLVEVDFNQKRNKIPELLFGHFIEHWGRCINFDGICAEMLINNKFEDIPGSNYYCTGVAFPWELTKFSWGVGYSIDKLIYKTGNSSQLIDKKNGNQYYYGICQKVWVEKNKTYNIRITLKTNKVGIKVRLAFTDSKEKEVYGQNELKVDSPLWETHNIQITSSAYDRNARFSISIKDTARLWIDFVSLMEAEHINTCRRDLVEKIRDIKPSIIRWPGGWFADHYHWRDGIGPVEERPTRVRRELSPIEPNNFGTDECETGGRFSCLKRQENRPPVFQIGINLWQLSREDIYRRSCQSNERENG